MARWIMIAGALLIIIGAVLHFAPGLLSWFGRLPGDINIKTQNSRVFIPITSMIIISIVITILLNLLRR
jgi:H+/Cl- antiporter ClcA